MSSHRRSLRWIGTRLPRATVPALVVLLLLALFLIGFTVGAALGTLPGPVVPRTEEPAPGQRQLGDLPGTVDLLQVRTTDRTLLTYVTSYSGCGCTERRSAPAGEDLAGLDEGELAGRLTEWQLDSFGASEVEVHRVVPGLCPEMAEYRTLGALDGKIAVFYGRPVTGLLLLRVTGISLDVLPAADRDRLGAGIVVRGDQSVERYLEGLPD
ncbi:MAG: hypothetical protein Q8P31_13135 [Bacillota bacterium]|nr:hypothetical protein [Bacillota bacterium]